MEKELVLKIIASGEGIQTEFKRASSSIPSDVYETIRNTKKYLPLYVEGAKPQFIEDYTFTAIIPLHHATMIRFFDKWMQWMDFDTKYAPHIEKAVKNIPLHGIAPELDWNQLIVLLVSGWNEKGTRLKELYWPEKQTITPDEIKKVSSISEKGTML